MIKEFLPGFHLGVLGGRENVIISGNEELIGILNTEKEMSPVRFANPQSHRLKSQSLILIVSF
jgi:hypothetical protein